ncbi:MAG: hypothetical protein OEZ09_09425 [Betaproteobacteria bacterium]|nr:hypothetical protein [Betaproteobacteria bacterium]MDH4325828.1 hypothetical protein [Betaproteobacteria bacterium]MDH5211292.1 hypothetical protein [Betaproteobacteria bacterium]MDH5578666.1 hypothetical protein [Betaproteobacteria bacterium]
MKGAAALCAVLLSGCALLQPEAGDALQVREIVGGTVSAVRATPEEQRRRLVHAQQMYAAVPDDANRVRLAALLATLPPPWRDDVRAAGLLEPLAARSPDGAMAQLAGLLAASVAERRRLARELRAAESRIEAAESRAGAAEQRAGGAEQRAEAALRREEAAAERAGTLQRQVDALKAIERSILEREERRRTQKR